MKLHPARGAKFGLASAICFAVVTPINNLLRHEPVIAGAIVTSSVFAFLFFGAIGTLTDKLGGDVGEA